MNILQVTNLGYVNGGVETALIENKARLEALGHNVKIFTSNARPDLQHFSDYEFPSLETQPKLLRLFYRSFYPAPYVALKKVLEVYKPDIVHLHTISQISPSILFLFKKWNVIATVHQTEDYTVSILPWSFPDSYFKDGSHERTQLTFEGKLHDFYHRFINANIYRMGFKNVNTFIAVSSYMQNCLASDGIQSSVIPNATRLFEPASVDTNCRTLVYVGRLERTKGIQDILRALSVIVEKHPDAKLLIAGRGSYEKELRDLTKELSLDTHVEFLGHLDRNGVYDLYRRASIVVMPSIWPESFGMVGIEALSVSRPVIASNIGGTSDWLVDGECGYAIPTESPDVIAKKVLTLWSDPALLTLMSQKARERSLHFSIDLHIESLVGLYNKVLDNAKKSVG